MQLSVRKLNVYMRACTALAFVGCPFERSCALVRGAGAAAGRGAAVCGCGARRTGGCGRCGGACRFPAQHAGSGHVLGRRWPVWAALCGGGTDAAAGAQRPLLPCMLTQSLGLGSQCPPREVVRPLKVVVCAAVHADAAAARGPVSRAAFAWITRQSARARPARRAQHAGVAGAFAERGRKPLRAGAMDNCTWSTALAEHACLIQASMTKVELCLWHA